MSAASILVVDDTPTNIGVLLELLSDQGYTVLVAQDGETAIEQVHLTKPDLILLDVTMPGIDGFETCRRLKADAHTRDTPVIFMTARAATSDCIEGFRVGAADYVVKPFQDEEVLARVRAHLTLSGLHAQLLNMNHELERRVAERTAELRSALDEVQRLKQRLEAENTYLQQELRGDRRDIVGSSAGLQAVLRRVASVGPTDSTVLISGETGTGKELVARAVHEASRRRSRTMVKVNCAAMSAHLIESELFGHVKGAFTGASDRRIGRFELAHGGTLFLDEVGELPLDLQVKLLRVLQEREFEPVGSSKAVRVDVRVIAATNRDLQAEVTGGRFRADLYYRLNVVPIQVPPLRERREDIPGLVEVFLHRAARRIGRRVAGLHPSTLEQLVAYDWPGNIRDLENTIERAVILSEGDLLVVDLGPRADGRETRHQPSLSGPSVTLDAVSATTHDDASPPGGPAAKPAGVAPAFGRPNGALDAGSLSLQDAVRRHLLAVLSATGGVIEGPRGAAARLGLKPSTLRSRLKKLGMQGAGAGRPAIDR
jgi:DNA-binding NtrC family response regulator